MEKKLPESRNDLQSICIFKAKYGQETNSRESWPPNMTNRIRASNCASFNGLLLDSKIMAKTK